MWQGVFKRTTSEQAGLACTVLCFIVVYSTSGIDLTVFIEIGFKNANLGRDVG